MKTLVPYAVNWKISIGSARRLLHSASIFRFPLRYTFILIFLLFSFFKTSSPFLCFMGDIRWHALHPSNSFQDWGYTHKFFEQDCEGHMIPVDILSCFHRSARMLFFCARHGDSSQCCHTRFKTEIIARAYSVRSFSFHSANFTNRFLECRWEESWIQITGMI